MKLHLSHAQGRNAVTAYGEGYVSINRVRYERSLVLLPERVIEDWSPGFELLEPGHFESLLELGPEIVILGTGARQRFPHPATYRPLTAAGVGLEIMDTPAACRTFNILMAEDRRVAAVLLIE